MKDLYVTDHEPRQKKYHTLSDRENDQFYQIAQDLENQHASIDFSHREGTTTEKKMTFLTKIRNDFETARDTSDEGALVQLKEKKEGTDEELNVMI